MVAARARHNRMRCNGLGNKKLKCQEEGRKKPKHQIGMPNRTALKRPVRIWRQRSRALEHEETKIRIGYSGPLLPSALVTPRKLWMNATIPRAPQKLASIPNLLCECACVPMCAMATVEFDPNYFDSFFSIFFFQFAPYHVRIREFRFQFYEFRFAPHFRNTRSILLSSRNTTRQYIRIQWNAGAAVHSIRDVWHEDVVQFHVRDRSANSI